MARSVLAEGINPEVLKWARVSLNMPKAQAAKKMKLTVERIKAFESGTETPTVSMARKLGDLYGRAWAVFYLPEPPEDLGSRPDLRRLYRVLGDGTVELDSLPPEVMAALYEAESLRDVMIDLEPAPRRPPVFWDSSPEVAGANMREGLALTWVDQQNAASKGPHAVIAHLRQLLDDVGVMVVQFSVHVELARGFCLPHEVWPVVAMNAKDAPVARVFTIAHEVAHLLCHSSGGPKAVEAHCNAAAAAFLLPPDAVDELLDDRGTSPEMLAFADLRWLGRRAGVSAEAFGRRLHSLDLVRKSTYEAWRREALREGKHLRASSSGGNYYLNERMRLGPQLVQRVATAHANGLISLKRAARSLGVSTSSVERLMLGA